VSFGRQLRRYIPAIAALVAMGTVAAAVAFYILAHQRVRFPWQDRYDLNIALASAQAITPGQGQTVNVAGVAVGSIVDVRLKDGVALVKAQIDPDKLPHVYANATALVRPKTGLQDMVVALDPGTPKAKPIPDGGTLPVSRTRPQISLDQVLAGVDQDSRDYLRTLLSAGAIGVHDRGEQLRRLFKATAPTLHLTKSVTAALADRREKVERLVSNLRQLTEATAGKDTELASLVSSSAAAFRAIDGQQSALRRGIDLLPGTVDSARKALAAADPFSEDLGKTLDELLPATKKLQPALKSAAPLVRDATPVLGDLLKLTTTARPVLADLNPTTRTLLDTTPSLTRTFGVLDGIVNELAYNPPGDEEGYLFWLAWFAHNAGSLLSNGDAHGIFWRGQAMVSCSTLTALAPAGKTIGDVLGTLGAALPCPDAVPGKTTGGGG